jgi:hypothetical protein
VQNMVLSNGRGHGLIGTPHSGSKGGHVQHAAIQQNEPCG